MSRARAWGRRLRPLLTAALIAATSPAALAELRCQAPANLLRWPEEQPVWELCWLYPGDSSGPAGSGLELRDVRYRGVAVLARGHVPVVWSELGGDVPGCSGRCFRTWTSEADRFGIHGEVVPGYYESDLAAAPGESGGGTVLTICDRPAGAAPGECPWGEAATCGEGVAVERWEDGFRLTTQVAAGWYRYAMRWTFHRDGTIEPRFGFARGSAACAGAPAVDSAVWRLDLDVGGRRNRAEPLPDPEAAGAATGETATAWRTTAPGGELGYRLTAGSGDRAPRWLVTPFAAGVLADPGRGCVFDPSRIPLAPEAEKDGDGDGDGDSDGEADRDEERPPDLIFWYQASADDVATAGCRWVGPTLQAIGRWPPPRSARLFADGFESGGVGAWDAAVPATAPPAPRR